MKKQDLEKVLLKRALGFECVDVALEYAADENENLVLNKKKVTKKQMPPDISAAKALLEHYGRQEETELENMTDEQLKEERRQLLETLKTYEKGDGENDN